MSIPGVRPALHSNEALLSAGAWMDFNQHIHELCLCGRWFQARTLWLSVFEGVHLGVDPATPVVQPLDLPPLRRMPCCQSPCFRCENRRGGFQFPFAGIWTRRAISSRRGATPAETWTLAKAGHFTLDLFAPHMQVLAWRSTTSCRPTWRDCRGDWCWAWMESVATTRSLSGGFGGLATRLGMSQLSSSQPCRAPVQMLAGSCGWCLGCEAHWCDVCRGQLEFCPMCGSSNEEIVSCDGDGSGRVSWQRHCQLRPTNL